MWLVNEVHGGALRAEEGKGLMLQVAEKAALGKGAEPWSPESKGCSWQCLGWVQLGWDSVCWGQEGKEVGVAAIWNARSLYRNFSWREMKGHVIKTVSEGVEGTEANGLLRMMASCMPGQQESSVFLRAVQLLHGISQASLQRFLAGLTFFCLSGMSEHQGGWGRVGMSHIILQCLEGQHSKNRGSESCLYQQIIQAETLWSKSWGRRSRIATEAFLGLANKWMAQTQGSSSPDSPWFQFSEAASLALHHPVGLIQMAET